MKQQLCVVTRNSGRKQRSIQEHSSDEVRVKALFLRGMRKPPCVTQLLAKKVSLSGERNFNKVKHDGAWSFYLRRYPLSRSLKCINKVNYRARCGMRLHGGDAVWERDGGCAVG